CPSACDSAGRNTRTAESVGPPGGNGISRRTGLLGYCGCACAQSTAASVAQMATTPASLFIDALPIVLLFRCYHLPAPGDVERTHARRSAREIRHRDDTAVPLPDRIHLCADGDRGPAGAVLPVGDRDRDQRPAGAGLQDDRAGHDRLVATHRDRL